MEAKQHNTGQPAAGNVASPLTAIALTHVQYEKGHNYMYTSKPSVCFNLCHSYLEKNLQNSARQAPAVIRSIVYLQNTSSMQSHIHAL